MRGIAVAERGGEGSPTMARPQAPAYGLHAPPTGGLFAQPLFYAAVPYYMARGPPDSPAGLAGGPGGVSGHSLPRHPSPILSMDALKARIMEAAPGQVKHAICSAQFVPRAAAFTSLIQMAAKAKQPQKAIEIFEAMSAVDVQPNTFSYSALISALARAGRWQEAERYFEELCSLAESNPEMSPNTVTYAALISAYEKGGQLGKALSAFQQQLDAGVPPDLITYSSLVTACERAGNTHKAVELLDQLHSAGMVGNHQLYHGLLSSCQATGEWELGLEVFLGMQCAGVRPTPHTVNLLLGALVAAGQAGHALWLVREALRSSYELGTSSFNTVLQLLAGRGDWQGALSLYRAMGLCGPKARPDSTSAGLLVAACVQGGNAPLAAQLVEELAAQGLLQQAPGQAPSQGQPGAQPAAGNGSLPLPLPLPAANGNSAGPGRENSAEPAGGKPQGAGSAAAAAAGGATTDGGAAAGVARSFYAAGSKSGSAANASASADDSPRASSARYDSSSLSTLSVPSESG